MIDAPSWAARLGGEDFLAQTFARSHLVIPGDGDDGFTGLLSWHDLNELISSRRLEPPRLRLSRAGEQMPLHSYAAPVTTRRAQVWHRLQPAELHARLAEGASLVLDAVDEMHAPVRAAADGLERFLRAPVQVNVYASWTAREGFGVHWDDHDVVVCQVYGAKRWRIYHQTRQAPMWRDVEAPREPQGPPLADIVLHEGDVLYLPRGWWHAVSADQGEPSLHLTFGITAQTGADLLTWVVDQLRDRLPLRLDIPRFAPPQEQAAFVDVLRQELLTELGHAGMLQRWAASADTLHPGRARPSLPYLDRLPPEPSLTVRLTCSRARLDESPEEGTATLAAAGTAWDFADKAAPLLRLLADGRPVTLAQLAGSSGLSVADAAEVASVLVRGQAAAVVVEGDAR